MHKKSYIGMITALPLTNDRREGLTDIQQFGKVKNWFGRRSKSKQYSQFHKDKLWETIELIFETRDWGIQILRII